MNSIKSGAEHASHLMTVNEIAWHAPCLLVKIILRFLEIFNTLDLYLIKGSILFLPSWEKVL